MKYRPIQLDADEGQLLIAAIESWQTLAALGHGDPPVNRKVEREYFERSRPQLDSLRRKLLDHYGNRFRGPGKGAIVE